MIPNSTDRELSDWEVVHLEKCCRTIDAGFLTNQLFASISFLQIITSEGKKGSSLFVGEIKIAWIRLNGGKKFIAFFARGSYYKPSQISK